jgi:hypothetical protein
MVLPLGAPPLPEKGSPDLIHFVNYGFGQQIYRHLINGVIAEAGVD